MNYQDKKNKLTEELQAYTEHQKKLLADKKNIESKLRDINYKKLRTEQCKIEREMELKRLGRTDPDAYDASLGKTAIRMRGLTRMATCREIVSLIEKFQHMEGLVIAVNLAGYIVTRKKSKMNHNPYPETEIAVVYYDTDKNKPLLFDDPDDIFTFEEISRYYAVQFMHKWAPVSDKYELGFTDSYGMKAIEGDSVIFPPARGFMHIRTGPGNETMTEITLYRYCSVGVYDNETRETEIKQCQFLDDQEYGGGFYCVLLRQDLEQDTIDVDENYGKENELRWDVPTGLKCEACHKRHKNIEHKLYISTDDEFSALQRVEI